MDRRSLSARATARPASSAAQENQEPVGVRITSKALESAAPAPAKAKHSGPSASVSRKHRRALHSIDSNRPRPVSHSAVAAPKRPLSNAPSRALTDPLEATKSGGQATTSIQNATEANKAAESMLSGHKRPATTTELELKTPGELGDHTEQESENWAWTDMILALLEKRYGSKSALPVCLTDLEAANMFKLPQRKKIKTGIASGPEAAKSRSSLDATRTSAAPQTSSGVGTKNCKMPAPSSTNSQQIPARSDREQEPAKEDKRQRLLLRHAQQIQASSVSSSTSCGCKTGCLKMYCMCFSSRGFCHAGCACEDCKNGRKNKTERVEAIQNYLANDPRAFSFASLPQTASTSGFLHLLPQKSSAVVMRGCRCKKSKCLKKYCECFQNGIACTSHCRCMDCSNHSESTAAHQHPHLQKASVAAHKRDHSILSVSPTAGSKPFHPVQITVTKQPRRNHVGKTLRLNL